MKDDRKQIVNLVVQVMKKELEANKHKGDNWN